MGIVSTEPSPSPASLSQTWERRVLPDFQLTGISPDGLTYVEPVRPLQDTSDARDYSEALNGVRGPLQERLRTNEVPAVLRFYVPKIIDTVSQVTETLLFPQNRVVMSHDLEAMPEYRQALDDRVTRPIPNAEIAQYDPLLGIVRINSDLYDEQDPRRHPIEVIDAVANSLGRAAIGDIVDVSFDAKSQRYRTWNGLVWRPGNERRNYYGELLNDAVATHIAALVRKEMHLIIPEQRGSPAAPLAMYRRPDGFKPADMLATGVRILGENVDQPDGPGVDLHRLLAQFAISGRDSASREAPAEVIKQATVNDSSFRLETLEALRPTPGMPLGVLHRIEEAVGLDPERRPSLRFA